MLKEDLEKKLNEWVESMPAGPDGITAICEQTGEPFEQARLLWRLSKKDFTASEMFDDWIEQIKPYLDKRPGLIYWRKRPEVSTEVHADFGDLISIDARFSKAVA